MKKVLGFSLPMRDGNSQRTEQITPEVSFSLPMRDGNSYSLSKSFHDLNCFSLPMRDGN